LGHPRNKDTKAHVRRTRRQLSHNQSSIALYIAKSWGLTRIIPCQYRITQSEGQQEKQAVKNEKARWNDGFFSGA